MSTILEALRRLEEDRPAAAENSTDSEGREQAGAHGSLTETLLATDPRAADQLRERILAEEAAPRMTPSDERSRGRLAVVLERRGLAIGSALILFFAIGVVGFSLTNGGPTQDSEGASDRIVEARQSAPAGAADSPDAIEVAAAESADPVDPTRIGVSALAPALMDSASPPTAERSAPVPAIVSVVTTDAGTNSIPSSAQASTLSPTSPTPTPLTPAAPGSASAVRSTSPAPSVPPAKSAPEPVALAAVVPTQSAADADPLVAGATRSRTRAERTSPGSVAVHTPTDPSPPKRSPESQSKRPSPTRAESAPAVVSAPAPPSPDRTASALSANKPNKTSTARPKKTAPAPRVARSDVRPPAPPAPATPPTTVAAEKPTAATTPSEATSKPSPRSPRREVARIDRSSLPDVSVSRTSWHPRAENRSAKIRLESTGEALVLREGDAVGGLVVQEITPSSVLFTTGDIEIRRRVGQSGSSR